MKNRLLGETVYIRHGNQANFSSLTFVIKDGGQQKPVTHLPKMFKLCLRSL